MVFNLRLRLWQFKRTRRLGTESHDCLSVYEWLQIDLGTQRNVYGVATQGRGAINQFVTKYNLQYSDDGVSFNYYKEQEAVEKKVEYINIHQIF